MFPDSGGGFHRSSAGRNALESRRRTGLQRRAQELSIDELTVGTQRIVVQCEWDTGQRSERIAAYQTPGISLQRTRSAYSLYPSSSF